MSKSPQNQSGHNNILVIKLSALGDFIQALGAMKSIRAHHKDAHITLMTTKPFVGFAEKCGYFDKIIIDEKPSMLNLKGWLALRRSMIAPRYTRIYDLQNNDRTALYFRLLPTKHKPEWVGAAKGASHENNSPERTKGHAFDGHVQTLALAGIKNIEIDTLDWITEDLSQFALNPPYALLVIGSSPQHPQKRWPASHYSALAQELQTRGIQPVLIGGRAEQQIAQDITAACKEAINLTEKTSLFQIAALGAKAKLAVGNDTGPMHLIAATSCPSLCLFSQHSNPVRHVPKGKNVKILRSDKIEDIKLEDILKEIDA